MIADSCQATHSLRVWRGSSASTNNLTDLRVEIWTNWLNAERCWFSFVAKTPRSGVFKCAEFPECFQIEMTPLQLSCCLPSSLFVYECLPRGMHHFYCVQRRRRRTAYTWTSEWCFLVDAFVFLIQTFPAGNWGGNLRGNPAAVQSCCPALPS